MGLKSCVQKCLEKTFHVYTSFNRCRSKMCISIQSDNCSLIAAAAKNSKSSTPTAHTTMLMKTKCLNLWVLENPRKKSFKNFAGLGTHCLNNAFWYAINWVNFFEQPYEFALKYQGPNLANTRWYGHLRQLDFVEKKYLSFELPIGKIHPTDQNLRSIQQ